MSEVLREDPCRHSPDHVAIYIQVEDPQAYLDEAERLGAKTIVPPTPVPGGMGHIAVFADPAGNNIGLHKFLSLFAAVVAFKAGSCCLYAKLLWNRCQFVLSQRMQLRHARNDILNFCF